MAENKETKAAEAQSAFIDRIEGSMAVLLIGDTEKVIPKRQLPRGAKEGMWLTPDLKAIDHEMTERVKKEIAEKRAKLMAQDDGDDFAL